MEHRITSAYHPQVTYELTVKLLTHIYLTFDFVFFGKGCVCVGGGGGEQ